LTDLENRNILVNVGSKQQAMKVHKFKKTLNYCSHLSATEAQNTDRGQLPDRFITGKTAIDISDFLNQYRYPCETKDFKQTKAGWVVHLATGIKYKIESDATPGYSNWYNQSGSETILMKVVAPAATVFYSNNKEIQAIN
jgi:hypothetical protein